MNVNILTFWDESTQTHCQRRPWTQHETGTKLKKSNCFYTDFIKISISPPPHLSFTTSWSLLSALRQISPFPPLYLLTSDLSSPSSTLPKRSSTSSASPPVVPSVLKMLIILFSKSKIIQKFKINREKVIKSFFFFFKVVQIYLKQKVYKGFTFSKCHKSRLWSMFQPLSELRRTERVRRLRRTERVQTLFINVMKPQGRALPVSESERRLGSEVCSFLFKCVHEADPGQVFSTQRLYISGFQKQITSWTRAWLCEVTGGWKTQPRVPPLVY